MKAVESPTNRRIVKLLIPALITVGVMLVFGPKDTLDKRFFYTADEAKTFFYGLDAEQTGLYFTNELFDFLWMYFYTALLYLGAFKLFPKQKFVQALMFVPVIFDLVETTTIVAILKKFSDPERLGWLGYITLFKWTSVGVALLLLVIGFIRYRTQNERGPSYPS